MLITYGRKGVMRKAVERYVAFSPCPTPQVFHWRDLPRAYPPGPGTVISNWLDSILPSSVQIAP